jgi:hypothetical protein
MGKFKARGDISRALFSKAKIDLCIRRHCVSALQWRGAAGFYINDRVAVVDLAGQSYA